MTPGQARRRPSQTSLDLECRRQPIAEGIQLRKSGPYSSPWNVNLSPAAEDPAFLHEKWVVEGGGGLDVVRCRSAKTVPDREQAWMATRVRRSGQAARIQRGGRWVRLLKEPAAWRCRSQPSLSRDGICRSSEGIRSGHQDVVITRRMNRRRQRKPVGDDLWQTALLVRQRTLSIW